MKPLALAFAVLLLVLSGCKNSTDCTQKEYNAILTGYDLRLCACCGGLMLAFDDDPKPYSGKFYLVKNTPSELGITEQDTFPIYATITWKEVEHCAPMVEITSFKRR